jgi:ParB family transcriptional regulator, chromosome partitioning protein
MSAPPKRGLGRGLGALLGEGKPAVPVTTGTLAPPPPAPSGAPIQLRVDSIRPNPWQPRKHFEPEALADLQRSIRELGVLVPILVRKRADGYELIAGERRWRASAALHLETIPAIVRDADDRNSLEVAIVENVLREDLDPLEEAMGYANLMEEYDYTQERVAERLGKSRSAVANALRLLALPDVVKAELRAKTLSAGHARALLALPEHERVAMAQRILAQGLTVRDVERLAAETPKAKARPKRRTPAKNPDLERAEGTLRYRLGAHVAIEPAEKGGKIAIRYADEEDLIRLVDLLAPEA